MKARILQKHPAIYMTLALGALFGVLLLRTDPTHTATPILIAGHQTIPITIADTPTTREQGLSDTPRLSSGTGKLFIFDQSDRYGFWMKDMHYPLDIVWIDADLHVVGIAEAVDPRNYPEIVYPPTPVQYVLEVNAHEAGGDNLHIGTALRLEK